MVFSGLVIELYEEYHKNMHDHGDKGDEAKKEK